MRELRQTIQTVTRAPCSSRVCSTCLGRGYGGDAQYMLPYMIHIRTRTRTHITHAHTYTSTPRLEMRVSRFNQCGSDFLLLSDGPSRSEPDLARPKKNFFAAYHTYKTVKLKILTLNKCEKSNKGTKKSR